jgi:hypothetical protein
MPRRSILLTPASPTLTTTETGGSSPRLRREGERQGCGQVLNPGAGRYFRGRRCQAERSMTRNMCA